MKRTGMVILLLTAIAVTGLSQDSRKQTVEVTTEQKARINKELDAAVAHWEKAAAAKDVEGLAKLYDLNTDVIHYNDIHHRTRTSVRKQFSEQFKNEPNLKKRFSGFERIFLTPNIVVESAQSHITGWSDKSSPTQGRYTAIYMKKNTEWLIVHERAWWIAQAALNARTKDKPTQ